MGRLSTHVLDTVNGRPARDVAIELHRLDPTGSPVSIKQMRTNADGRTDEPLLIGPAFKTGTYVLSFHIGDYFRAASTAASEPPFLDIVPIRFTKPRAVEKSGNFQRLARRGPSVTDQPSSSASSFAATSAERAGMPSRQGTQRFWESSLT